MDIVHSSTEEKTEQPDMAASVFFLFIVYGKENKMTA